MASAAAIESHANLVRLVCCIQANIAEVPLMVSQDLLSVINYLVLPRLS